MQWTLVMLIGYGGGGGGGGEGRYLQSLLSD